MKVTDFVAKENYCRFRHYRKGFFYYSVRHVVSNMEYQFSVPIEDLGDATLLQKEKSLFLMRYIRKAIEEGTMVNIDISDVPQPA